MIDKKSYSLLNRLYKVGEMKSEDAWKLMNHQHGTSRLCPQISALLSAKLIDTREEPITADGEGGYFKAIRYYNITVAGRAFVEQRRRDKRNFWVPYGITTFVALASLAVSLLDIFLKAN